MTCSKPSGTPNMQASKLAYRAKSPLASSFVDSSMNSTYPGASTDSESPSVSPSVPDSPLPSPLEDLASAMYGEENSSWSSIAASSPAHGTQEKGSKKSNVFAGIFNIREPSAQALVEYQKQMTKQKPSRKGRVSVVGILGTSSAQLPPTVPKVNSKWDGLPQSLKDKGKRKDLHVRRSISTMNESFRSAHSGDSNKSLSPYDSQRPESRETLGKMSTYSGGSQNRLADIYGWEVAKWIDDTPSQDGAGEECGRITSQSSAASRGGRGPARPNLTVISPPENRENMSRYHQKSPAQQSQGVLLPTSPGLPSPLPSPSRTAPEAVVLRSESVSSNCKIDVSEDAESVRPSALYTQEITIRSTGSNILGPPVSAKQRTECSTTPSVTSIEHRQNSAINLISSQGRGNPSDLSSGKGGTLAETRSPRRRDSVQERLSLGINLKHQAVPPWAWSELHPETPAVSYNGWRTASPSPSRGSLNTKKKRFGLFKK